MSIGAAVRSCFAAILSVPVVGACAATDSPPSQRATTPACVASAAGAPAPILAIHHVPSLSAERYDAVVRTLTNGGDRLESVSDGGLEGLLVHVAGQGADGFWIVDVWESQAAINRFSERVRPIARSFGIEEPMRTYSVHNFLAC